MKNDLFKISEEEKNNILESHNVYKCKPKYNVSVEILMEQRPTNPSTQNTTNNNQQTQSSQLPAWVNDYPALKEIGELKKTQSDDQVYSPAERGDNLFFGKDKFFRYRKADNTAIDGTWEIQDGHLIINTEDGQQWSKGNGWKDTWKTIALEKFEDLKSAGKRVGKEILQIGNKFFSKLSNYIRQNQSGSGSSLQGVFVPCDERFPILKGCKNETIRKIQACIGVLPDGKFGPITSKKLKDLNLPGEEITQDSFDRACSNQNQTTGQNTTNTQTSTQNTTNNQTQVQSTTGTQTTDRGTSTTNKRDVSYYDDYRTAETEVGDESSNPMAKYDNYSAVEGDETTPQTTTQPTPQTTTQPTPQRIPQIRKKLTDMSNVELAFTKQNTPLMFKNLYDKLGPIEKKIVDDKLSGETK